LFLLHLRAARRRQSQRAASDSSTRVSFAALSRRSSSETSRLASARSCPSQCRYAPDVESKALQRNISKCVFLISVSLFLVTHVVLHDFLHFLHVLLKLLHALALATSRPLGLNRRSKKE
jgi:hypothetical protein